jgi:uncharacterized caspase-like protein
MRFSSFIAAIIVLAAAAAPAFADRRVALVIGNAAYRSMAQLQNPRNDAADVAAALRRLDFEAIAATDLDRSGMNDALDRFSRLADGADIAVVYYSGHGMQFGGTNYLLPVDARLDSAADINRFRLMPLDDVMEALRRVRGVAVLVLDACRNNPVENEMKRRLAATSGDRGELALTRGLKPQPAGNGLLIAYATQSNDVASDGVGRHSPFTSAFLNNVETPGIDLRLMMLRVQDDVDNLTDHRQRPEVSNSIVGEFKLKPAVLQQDGAQAFKPAAPYQDGSVSPGKPGASQQDPGPNAEAVQAWKATKDTTSIAVLDDFIRQFGNTPYGSMARARREELRNSQANNSQLSTSQVAALPPDLPREIAKELPKPHAAGEGCSSRSHALGTDLYCASSALSPQLGNTYGVEHLFDGNRAAAWVEGAPGHGIGEWITVEFNAARLVRSVTIDNGYQKNYDIFYKNSRVSRMTLVFSNGERKTVSLQDQFGQQTISLDRPIRARWIQFIIDDVYPGNKYQDTAISKLSVAAQ